MDIALWDLRCRHATLPLWKLAGGAVGSTKAYGGGIDLSFSVEKLQGHVRGYVSAGHNAVKIKLGRPMLAEYLARVAAVREAVGPDVTVMVDANFGVVCVDRHPSGAPAASASSVVA